MPSHFAAGCGARQRFAPVGGAANGMPLNTRTDAVSVPAPDSWPVSILTGSGISAFTLVAIAIIAPKAPIKLARFMSVASIPKGESLRNLQSEDHDFCARWRRRKHAGSRSRSEGQPLFVAYEISDDAAPGGAGQICLPKHLAR